MTHYYDRHFTSAKDFIGYFLQNPLFRTRHKFQANQTGKGGMIFRGQSKSTWKLIPSVFRPESLANFTPQPPTTEEGKLYLGLHLHAELRAVRIFLKAADALGLSTPLDYTRMTDTYDMINALGKGDDRYDYHQPFPPESFQRATGLAQHHGVPTRFLDWSESPLVASYFAAYSASSFAGHGSGTQAEEIAVIFLSTHSLFEKTSPISLVEAPRHESSYLLQQKGVFTNFKECNAFFLEHGRWPSFDDYSSDQFQLQRALLPATEADNLLRELFDLDITRHSLMPSLSNAATAYQYVKTLYTNRQVIS